MSFIFLGHQGWIITGPEISVAINPNIYNGFGSNFEPDFFIYPYRVVEKEFLPKIDAIILSTEHIQNFHPPTLEFFAQKNPNIKIFIHQLFPKCAVQALERLNVSIHRLKDGEHYKLGPQIGCRLFANPGGVLPWDRRAASIVIDNECKYHLFQSDTKFSDALVGKFCEIETEIENIFVTINSPTNSSDQCIGLDNLLPISNGSITDWSEVLITSLLDNLQKLPFSRNLILIGSGYRDKGCHISPNMSMQELATYANELSLGTKVYSPVPGEEYTEEFLFKSSVSWINLTQAPFEKESKDDNSSSWPPPLAPQPESSSISLSQEILDEIGKALTTSDFGRQLPLIDEFLGRELGKFRFIIQVLDDHNSFELKYDLTTARFEEHPYSGFSAIRKFPFGIIIHKSDLIAIFEGSAQIWEVSICSARQWYVGDRFKSPMAFFYQYFNEGINQQIAKINFLRHLTSQAY